MTFLSRWRSAFLSGKAFMKFNQKKYKDVVYLLEKACKLDPNADRIEISYRYLGHSYIQLGQIDNAYKIMSKAYDLFLKNRSKIIEDKSYQQSFVQLASDFIYVLNKIGQNARANEIARDLKEWRKIEKGMGSGLDNGQTA